MILYFSFVALLICAVAVLGFIEFVVNGCGQGEGHRTEETDKTLKGNKKE